MNTIDYLTTSTTTPYYWATTNTAPITSDGWRTVTYRDINGIRGWTTDTTTYSNVVFHNSLDLFDFDLDIDRKYKDEDISEEELLELLGGEE